MFGVRILSPANFARARWWQPLRPGPMWFYHTPAPEREPVALYVTPHSLDRDLSPLVAFLHSQGVPTTPSCQGHWMDRRGSQVLFDQLRQDAERIRRQGLPFEDCETQVQHVVYEPSWELPWDSSIDLFDDLRRHAGCGYIGFRAVPGHWTMDWTEWARECLPAVQVQHRAGVTNIHVQSRSPEEQQSTWAKVNSTLREAAS